MIHDLNKFYQLIGIPSIETIEGYTFREILAKFQDKIKECISEYNSLENNVKDKINAFDEQLNVHIRELERLLSEGVAEEVANYILQMYNDGTLADIIAEQVFGELTSQINEARTILDSLKEEYNNFSDNIRIVPHKSASVTIANSNTPTDETYRQLFEAGLKQTLCPMINIADLNSTTFTLMSRGDVVNAITNAKNKGVETEMLKPHLGVNWSDSTYRPSYNPSNYQTFFNNWLTVLEHYAGICDEYSIPYLCIGCEMDKVVEFSYNGSWGTICDTLRTNHPNLKLTYATTTTDFMRNENATLPHVDSIGVNLYLQWNSNPYTMGMTYKDIIPSFFDSYAPITTGFKANDRINEISFKYKKPIYITEIGVIPRVTGLQVSKPADYDDRTNENFEISKIVFQAFFETLCKNNNLEGFSLWHVKEPFNFFNYDATVGNSVAVDMIKEYIQGGLI